MTNRIVLALAVLAASVALTGCSTADTWDSLACPSGKHRVHVKRTTDAEGNTHAGYTYCAPNEDGKE
jgi:predicted component of type VI protein secretion system